MHRDAEKMSSGTRQRAVRARKKRTNVYDANFCVEDYVLNRCRAVGGHKLRFRWKCPRRVVATHSPTVYTVDNFFKEKLEAVHAQLMMLYRSKRDSQEVSTAFLKTIRHVKAQYQKVEKFHSLRFRSDNNKLDVKI